MQAPHMQTHKIPPKGFHWDALRTAYSLVFSPQPRGSCGGDGWGGFIRVTARFRFTDSSPLGSQGCPRMLASAEYGYV